ncbi:MAG: hypothetical protein BWZ10_02974 [candidate division BRC1 bacterium ADurb.BinA364]|nr:MAG: hypothetical protein BWZ10_02974 [candidate division BRC1 bacterium ADurb.BinA364]
MRLIASAMRFIASRPRLAASLASLAIALAWFELSAFCLVIEDISSSEAEDSSMLEACSLAPLAIDWLAEATWLAAEPTCSAPCIRPRITLAIGRVMLSTIIKASAMPRIAATIRPPIIRLEAVDKADAALSAMSFVLAMPAAEVACAVSMTLLPAAVRLAAISCNLSHSARNESIAPWYALPAAAVASICARLAGSKLIARRSANNLSIFSKSVFVPRISSGSRKACERQTACCTSLPASMMSLTILIFKTRSARAVAIFVCSPERNSEHAETYDPASKSISARHD